MLQAYPADQADLARVDPENPDVAERFEVFCGPVELANGYRELTDPDEFEQRVAADRDERSKRGLPDVEPDAALMAAMQHGLPECAGVALGFDRCLAIVAGFDNLRDAQAFECARIDIADGSLDA